MKRKKIVIFDFDGVIADTTALHFKINKQLDTTLTREVFSQKHQGNIYTSLEKEHQNQSGGAMTHVKDFFALYEKYLGTVRLFPQITEELSLLSEQTDAFYIVTSSEERFVHYLVEKYHIEHLFSGIYGRETAHSKEEKMQRITHQYPQAQCVFVTDTLGDLLEARAIEMDALAVLWGMHDRDTLLRGAPYGFIERPEMLAQVVGAYFQ